MHQNYIIGTPDRRTRWPLWRAMGRLSVVSACCFGSLSSAAPAIDVRPEGFSDTEWIAANTAISLQLSQPTLPTDGNLAILVGTADLTDLFRPTAPGRLTFDGSTVPLPSGEADLKVFWVSGPEQWEEIASLPIKVLTPAGFEVAEWAPRVELSAMSQFKEKVSGDAEPSPRGVTYTDMGVQAGFDTTHRRQDWEITSNANFVGTSVQEEALRFGEKGDGAPKFDMSDYLVGIKKGATSFSQGHVSFGNQPLLVEGFGTRGLLLNHQLTDRVRFSVTSQNARGLVGFDELLGYTQSDNRILSAALGVELMPEDPGTLFTELTYFYGKARNETSFNVGEVADAEKNTGYAVRLGGNGFDGRLRGLFDYAVSTYNNPDDPVLSQGFDTVPVDETTDNAYSLDLAYDLLQGFQVTDATDLNLTLSYLRGRTDPLYRGLAAAPTPDTLADTWGLTGSAGLVAFQVEHIRAEDNLDSIESVLKTKTRDTRFSVAVPFAALAEVDPEDVWWPRDVAYSYQDTHQFGANLPLGFDDPASQIPDQKDRIHQVNLNWDGDLWNFGYGFAFSEQDNLQEGRANADFRNRGHTFSLGLRPIETLSVGFGFAYTIARDVETDVDSYSKGFTLDLDWRFHPDWTLTGNYGITRDDDDRDLDKSDQTTAQTQVAWRFKVPAWGGEQVLPGQLFLRHTYLDLSSESPQFGLSSSGRTWAIFGGLSLSLF